MGSVSIFLINILVVGIGMFNFGIFELSEDYFLYPNIFKLLEGLLNKLNVVLFYYFEFYDFCLIKSLEKMFGTEKFVFYCC